MNAVREKQKARRIKDPKNNDFDLIFRHSFPCQMRFLCLFRFFHVLILNHTSTFNRAQSHSHSHSSFTFIFTFTFTFTFTHTLTFKIHISTFTHTFTFTFTFTFTLTSTLTYSLLGMKNMA